MKNPLLYLVITFLFNSSLVAQEFSFSLFFEDAIGNKDTIIIGYDENATDGEDLIFGELDIKDLPLNGAFEVRAVEYDYYESGNAHSSLYPFDYTTFHSKIQIVKTKCFSQGPFPPPGIIVKADHYPLTVSWDSTLFNQLCNNQTIFTDYHPGGWFDAGTNFKTFVRLADSSTAIIEKHFDATSYLINNDLDTIKTFFLGFLPDGIINTKDNFNKNDHFKIFPNPSQNSFFIKNKNANPKDIHFQLLDFQGIIVLENQTSILLNQNIEVQTTHLPSGIYFLKIEDLMDNNTFTIQKIIVQK